MKTSQVVIARHWELFIVIIRHVGINDVSGSLMGDPVVMLSLYPEFPQSVMSSLASCGEFVLLLDRSGSMSFLMSGGKQTETRIASARVFSEFICHQTFHSDSHTVFFTILSLLSSGYSHAPVEELTNGLLLQHLQFWLELSTHLPVSHLTSTQQISSCPCC